MAWILAAALLGGLLCLPVVVEGEVLWQQLTLSGWLNIRLGRIRLVQIRALADLEPVRLEAVIRRIGQKERPLFQQKKSRGALAGKLERTVRRSLICKKMTVDFALGIAEDAAATALACGALQTLTGGLILWARQKGAKIAQGSVQANFQESRYEGRIEGIFQTSMAHIILSMIQTGRKG